MKVLMATHNAGKKKEFEEILRGLNIELLMLDDLPERIDLPEEVGTTYVSNALLKAKIAAEKTGLLTFADDSGIEVRALSGQLGVHSARYAEGSDAMRCEKLLKAMEGQDDRSAVFVCVIVLYDPNGKKHHTFRGEWRGRIASSMRGSQGFGYDPIFIPVGYEQTSAELGSRVKNALSHRAIAAKYLRAYLSQLKQ